jgi:proteasome accessory factor B
VESRRRTGINFEDMSQRRAERLVNLVILLLSTRQYLTAERIRSAIDDYARPDGTEKTEEAFKRMFERDKAELRDLGVPLETGTNSIFDSEDGYRIKPADYELPPIEFDAAEAAAVGIAARTWQSATLGAAANSALVKLRAAGVDLSSSDTFNLIPYLDGADQNLQELLDAVRDRKAVRFDYQKAHAAEPEQRTLEPWGVLSWRRRWYVVGFDRGRGEPRSFRLSRVVGKVKPFGTPDAYERPVDVDMLEMVSGGPDDSRTARIEVTGPGAGQLRRAAESNEDGVLTVSYSDLNWLARIVASAGTSARVIEPPELVDAVKTRLVGVV